MALVQQGDWPRAVKLLKKHCKANPGDATALEILAQFLFDDGDLNGAFKVLQEGMSFVPTPELWHVNLLLGRLHERLEMEGPWIKRSRGQLEAIPPKPGYDEQAFRAGHRLAALRAYQDALNQAPERLESLLLLIRGLVRDASYQAVLPLIDRLLRTAPQDVEARYLKAHCLHQSGDPAQALPILEKLAQELPTDDVVLKAYEAALQATGRKGDSTRIAKRMDSLGIFPPYVIPPDDDKAIKLVRDAIAGGGSGLGARALAARATLLFQGDTKIAVIVALLHHGVVTEMDGKLVDKLLEAENLDLLWGLARESKTASVRKACLWALTRTKAKGIFETLLRSLPYDVGEEYLDVAGALGELKDERAVPILAEIARASHDIPARRRAVLAMGAISSRECAAHLQSLLQDPTVGAWAAAGRFRQSGDAQFLELARAATDKDDALEKFLEAATNETVVLQS
jgi:tetratricopeptide (TPR) repeat protein